MSNVKIAVRNKANAQKSTGPKTAQGKSVVAANAIRHGATGRPEPESIACWLAIILDDPSRPMRGFVPRDEMEFRALALAEAEAKLVAAERALQVFEAERSCEPDNPKGAQEAAQHLFGALDHGAISEKGVRSLVSIMSLLEQLVANRGRQRLLKRYIGEAQAQRRKAFREWLWVAEGNETVASNQEASNPETNPK